jgi:stage II sporulation protein D
VISLVPSFLTMGRPRRTSRHVRALAASGFGGLLSVSTFFGSVVPTYAQDIVVINGRGFGHGVGLAQDGAYWMGRAGRSATEILRLFFPGTVIAKRGGTVRVPLGGGGSAQLGFPNGGNIGDLRVPAGGSVSVRASGGEVIASVLSNFSAAEVPTDSSEPTIPTGFVNIASLPAKLPEPQPVTPLITPSAVGTAALDQRDVLYKSERGENTTSISQRNGAAIVELSAFRNEPTQQQESTLSNFENEIVNAVERFQVDTPIVLTVPTTTSASVPNPSSTPTATNGQTSAIVPTNPPANEATTNNPAPTNPTQTTPAPTVSGPSPTLAPDGGESSTPIVTSVGSGAEAVPTVGATSIGSTEATQPGPTDTEATGASPKTRRESTQGSSLLANSGGATIAFNGRRYRGAIEFNGSGGSLRITNSVDLEDYLKGMGEILTPSWPSAALQSQAIAARTYALRTMAIDGQVCPTQRCQVYLGAQAEYPKMSKAVDATRGKVLTYGGKLAATFYSASGGGTIATPEEGFGGGSSQQPYLRAGSYPTGDVLAWTVRMPLGEVARRVGYGGTPRGVTVTRVGASGRALEVTVDGSSGPLRVGGPKFDAALGLKSTFFTINEPVFGASGSDGSSSAFGSGAGGPGGSSSDLTSALAALGLSNATPLSALEDQSRLLAAADPDFAAGAASTSPLFDSTSSGYPGAQTSPDFGSSGFSSSDVVPLADSPAGPTTSAAPATTPKPTQPDRSAGSTIEAINLPQRDASSQGSGDVVFLAVPTAMLGLVGFGLRRRVKANRAAAVKTTSRAMKPAAIRQTATSGARPTRRPGTRSSTRSSTRPTTKPGGVPGTPRTPVGNPSAGNASARVPTSRTGSSRASGEDRPSRPDRDQSATPR